MAVQPFQLLLRRHPKGMRMFMPLFVAGHPVFISAGKYNHSEPRVDGLPARDYTEWEVRVPPMLREYVAKRWGPHYHGNEEGNYSYVASRHVQQLLNWMLLNRKQLEEMADHPRSEHPRWVKWNGS